MLAPLAILALVTATAFAADSDGPAFFEKNVRPLLVERCLTCHSATSNPVMGGLRLDARDPMVKGGGRGAAVVAGKPGESLLIRAIRHADGVPKMPPGKKLSDAEISALARWVEMGAPWGATATPAAAEKFWSFVPPKEPAAPTVKRGDWVKNPIDAYVLAALESKGLAPAKPADKRALIRRATYDLIGLPPTPEDVRAFLADNTPGAYARVIERLLGSPRYGERWARHWLDVARYADSNGLDENLVYKNAYRYRDYVIQAFNKDKPYDLFIQEQLAGDLLPESADLATQFERWTATGFLSLGAKMLAEDDPVKMEMDIIDEQLDTTARTFMGLTLGCARCHDHKFDPIPASDYYSMAGIFKSSKTMENFKVVAKWHEYVLAPKEDRDRVAAHEAKLEAKQKEIGRATKAENDKLSGEARAHVGAYLLASHDVAESARVVLKPAKAAALVRESASFDAGNVARPLEPKKPNTGDKAKAPHYAEFRVSVATAGEYQIDIQDEERGRGTADLLINGELVKRGAPPVENREASPDEGGWASLGVFALRAGENAIRFEHRARFPYFAKFQISPHATGSPAPRTTVQIASAHKVNPSFLEQMVEHLDRSKAAPASALWAWETFGSGRPHSEWTSPAAKLFADIKHDSRAALAAAYQELFAKAAAKSDDPSLTALHELLVEKFGPFRAPADARNYYTAAALEQLAKLDKEQKELEAATPEYPRAMGVRESDKVTDLAIHLRGSHWTLGKVVPRHFLAAIDGGDSALPATSSGRLDLARWLTGKNHPLTARVMANRLWRWHFGRGIVPTVDNFGRLGDKPSNQALLDWLALRFVDSGWSIKAMHKTMMLSNTYQMSSDYDERSAETDPSNALMWRASRRRLEAEEIRDAVMAVSGGLEWSAGGTILKYKDRQYVANTSRGGDIDYDRTIRTVYVPVIRSSMYDVLTAFDLPDPAVPNGDRDATVVAPQALFMLNSSVMLKHSRILAAKLLAQPGADDAARIREAYERALSRPPSAAEIDQALTFIARIEKTLPDDKKDRRELAWQSFCKSLIASNEFIYLN